MSMKGFAEGLNLITDTFGSKVIEGGRLNRIKKIFDERISDSGFIDICNNLCNTLRYPPLPVDFAKALEDWRKNYYYQNGRNYGEKVEEAKAEEMSCLLCFETGILKIKHHDSDSFQKLMRCACDHGARCASSLPQWDNALAGAFKKVALEAAWFNPRINENDSEKTISSKIWNKVSDWKMKIKESEVYWNELSNTKGA